MKTEELESKFKADIKAIEWRSINGFPLYEVSSEGFIRYCGPRKGKTLRSLNPDKEGYLMVTLKIGSDRRTLKAHRLVAMAFIPNPENKPQVNHINGVKSDNRVENLEWVTQSENNFHLYRILNHINRCSVPVAQLTRSGDLVAIHASRHHAAKALGLHFANISAVICQRPKGPKTCGGFVWRNASDLQLNKTA